MKKLAVLAVLLGFVLYLGCEQPKGTKKPGAKPGVSEKEKAGGTAVPPGEKEKEPPAATPPAEKEKEPAAPPEKEKEKPGEKEK